jgi:hypothetical protein
VTDFHVYCPLEAPMMEVEQNGTWWPGQARMRTTHRDGRTTYQVQYLRDGSNAFGRVRGRGQSRPSLCNKFSHR